MRDLGLSQMIHSMKMLYKHRRAAFSYAELVQEKARRGRVAKQIQQSGGA